MNLNIGLAPTTSVLFQKALVMQAQDFTLNTEQETGAHTIDG